jgi:hypothetical protein
MSGECRKPGRPGRDWASIFDEWKESGKTQTEFCADAGIPVATFVAALRRRRLRTPPGFVRAVPRSLDRTVTLERKRL